MNEQQELWRPLQNWLQLHPEYQVQHERSFDQMFYGDGPLPVTHRHFLALMAASRHRCRFLMSVHKCEFIRCGGEQQWLDRGLDQVPPKLAQLDRLNRTLAHQPWTLQYSDLEALTRSGGDGGNSSPIWSLSELVHSAVIICHTHAMCSFIIASGIKPSECATQPHLHKQGSVTSADEIIAPASASASTSHATHNLTLGSLTSSASSGEIDVLMQRMAELQQMDTELDQEDTDELNRRFLDVNLQSSKLDQLSKSAAVGNGSRANGKTPSPPVSPVRLKGRKESSTETACANAPHDCSQLNTVNGHKHTTNGATIPTTNCTGVAVDTTTADSTTGPGTVGAPSPSTIDTPTLYTKEMMFRYVDFATRPSPAQAPTLKSHVRLRLLSDDWLTAMKKSTEYSWENHGYSVCSQLCNQLGDILDKKFQFIQCMTYHTMGEHTQVDTSKYRTAIWNYIQSLYGIRHDDYNYAEVNLLLSIPMKTYIKTITCYPERTTSDVRNSVMTDFQYSEKVHVNVLVAEARLQAELLYFLRAVMRFVA